MSDKDNCYTCHHSEIFEKPVPYTDGIDSGELYGYCNKNDGHYKIYLPGGKCKDYKGKEGKQVSEELLEKTVSDWSNYNPGSHKDIKKIIQDNINSVCANYVAIGYYLNVVNNRELYREDGYSGIGEYAAAEYGIQKDKCSYLMKIADKFCIENSPALLPEYRDFTVSKLREMIYLTDEQLEQVTIATTVAEIREIRKPEPEKVATSQLESVPKKPSRWPKVCKWDGKSNCVAMCSTGAVCCAECEDHGSCNTECGWQDERIPKQKPSGKCVHRPEFQCTLPEASKVAQGDGENCNAKCCWNCQKHGSCGYECNSSAHRPVVSKFSIEEIVRYSVPHINIHEELKRLCAYNLPGSSDKVMQLMLEQKDSGNFAGKWIFTDAGFTYTPSDTLQTKTISWDEYCEAFRRDNRFQIEYYISEDKNLDPVNNKTEIVNHEPEIGNLDKNCGNCKYDTMDPDEYFIDHPGTKEFPCNTCDDKLSNWKPKVEESNQDELLPCDTCGREVQGCCDYPNTEDDYCVDGDKWIPIPKEPEPVETVEADIIQTVPAEPPKPMFSAKHHLKEAIEREEMQMTQLGDTWKMKQPDTYLKHQTILLALKCYLTDMEYTDPVPVKVEQPELPILKNNDQRKDFIDAYESWPIWIDQKETGERYYRYNLTDKIAMVVKVSLRHGWGPKGLMKEAEFGNEQYYLLGIQSDWSQKGTIFKVDETRTFADCSTNKSALVEYLKEFQKKGA